MTLRDDAERAAREIVENGNPAWRSQDIADAIERVAKQFSESACLHAFDAGYSAALADNMADDREQRERRDELVAAAIAEAEKAP